MALLEALVYDPLVNWKIGPRAQVAPVTAALPGAPLNPGPADTHAHVPARPSVAPIGRLAFLKLSFYSYLRFLRWHCEYEHTKP